MVDNNNITNEGVKELASRLEFNSSLLGLSLGTQCLHIDDNLIEDEGVKFLGNSLKENFTLSVLTLDNNKFKRAGGEALYNLLAANQTLTTVDLKGNEVPDRLVMDIKTATYKNTKRKRKAKVDELKTLTYNSFLQSKYDVTAL